MTKADLIDEVSRLAELTRKDSEVIVETIFDSVVRSLRAGDKIEIRGFGSFRTRQRKPRVGRNPKTGERVEVPAKKIPFFKPSKELKDLVNDSAAGLGDSSAAGCFCAADGVEPKSDSESKIHSQGRTHCAPLCGSRRGPRARTAIGKTARTNASGATCLLFQIQVGHLQRERFGIDVGAVGQHDDRQVVVGEALDGGAEADGAAVVRHALVALVGIEEPSEAVAQRGSVRNFAGPSVGCTGVSAGCISAALSSV